MEREISLKDIYLSPESFFHGRTTDRVLFIGINWCYGVEVDCLLVLQPFQPQVEIGLQWHIGVREGEGESKEGNSYGRWKKTMKGGGREGGEMQKLWEVGGVEGIKKLQGPES